MRLKVRGAPMKETIIICDAKPKLNDPICIAGLPGIGNIGRIAVGYMVTQLKVKKFADLYSPYFFPFIMINNDAVHVLRNEFYYYKNPNGRDIIFLIGDTQSYDPKGHYEVCGKIIEFLKEIDCKEVITIGGFGTGKVSDEKRRIYGVLTDNSMMKDYKKYDIKFDIGKDIGIHTVIGAAGLLPGIGMTQGMKGLILLGETTGFPIITDPTAAEAALMVLQKIIGIKIDLSKLDEKVKAMHEFINKLEDLQKQATEIQKGKKPEDLKYIG